MAEHYDDTNKGVAFKPYDDQQLILSGKLDVDGNENEIVLVKGITQKGKEIIRIHQMIGVMFKNDSENPQAPSWSGTLDYFKDKKIAAWKAQSANGDFLRLQVNDSTVKYQYKEPEQTSESKPSLNDRLEDEIPF